MSVPPLQDASCAVGRRKAGGLPSLLGQAWLAARVWGAHTLESVFLTPAKHGPRLKKVFFFTKVLGTTVFIDFSFRLGSHPRTICGLLNKNSHGLPPPRLTFFG